MSQMVAGVFYPISAVFLTKQQQTMLSVHFSQFEPECSFCKGENTQNTTESAPQNEENQSQTHKEAIAGKIDGVSLTIHYNQARVGKRS